MTDFYTVIDEYLGDIDDINDISDIRVVVRKLWFYDFDGFPTRLWQGKGRLFTQDGNEWLGTIDANNFDYHSTPPIQDGRDGSSATYNLGLTIPDIPGENAGVLYESLKSEQWRAVKRNVTCYLAVFKDGEGLRIDTPVSFFKQLTMMNIKCSEKLEPGGNGGTVRRYRLSVTAKDANFGRSNVPNGTYADTIQKFRAKEHGVALDRGSEFLASLANRTFQIP